MSADLSPGVAAAARAPDCLRYGGVEHVSEADRDKAIAKALGGFIRQAAEARGERLERAKRDA